MGFSLLPIVEFFIHCFFSKAHIKSNQNVPATDPMNFTQYTQIPPCLNLSKTIQAKANFTEVYFNKHHFIFTNINKNVAFQFSELIGLLKHVDLISLACLSVWRLHRILDYHVKTHHTHTHRNLLFGVFARWSFSI